LMGQHSRGMLLFTAMGVVSAYCRCWPPLWRKTAGTFKNL
jgi:hypothetical protein